MKRQDGITLIELLITITLASAVGLMVMNMYIGSSRTYADQNRILDAQREGRIALEAITRNLRQAGLDPLGAANAGVEIATATEIRVTMDLNMDGDVADSGERITYRRAGSSLQKGVGPAGAESWQSLAENVSDFTVDYFGELNPIAAPVTTAAELASIRSLIVTLTIGDDKASGGSFKRTYSTGIYCRNLFR